MCTVISGQSCGAPHKLIHEAWGSSLQFVKILCLHYCLLKSPLRLQFHTVPLGTRGSKVVLAYSRDDVFRVASGTLL